MLGCAAHFRLERKVRTFRSGLGTGELVGRQFPETGLTVISSIQTVAPAGGFT